MGHGQVAEQIVGGRTGDQQRALEQVRLAEQHFTARVHGRRLLKKVAQCSRGDRVAQLTTRRGWPAKKAWAFSLSWPTMR
ncbi:hypothetical protein D3C79_566230 [compost metagenome]